MKGALNLLQSQIKTQQVQVDEQWMQELSLCEETLKLATEWQDKQQHGLVTSNAEKLQTATSKLEAIRVSADIYSTLIEESSTHKDIKKDQKELANRINQVIMQFMQEKGYIQ